ncbi:MAG: response regulator [Candidatus Omnitrophota bacterium]|nr:response regulator [Candidatus Omnitrophota bacterium]MDZ4243412.1 response regulator [Candidatus Omnitrophota bacterium]
MGRKILVIDDNEGDRVLIRELLRENGIVCELVMAASGKDGMEKVPQEKPDVVLIDTNLKEIDGFEVCRLIRAMPGIDAKLIIMTGVVDALDAGRARRSGADDFCVKTSDCESIIQAVRKIIG